MLDRRSDLLRHYSSSDRPRAFAAWAEGLPRTKAARTAFWRAVAAEWSGFDRMDYHRFAKLFRRFRSSCPISLIEHLPENIRIFRGQDAGDAFGLAWTTDR